MNSRRQNRDERIDIDINIFAISTIFTIFDAFGTSQLLVKLNLGIRRALGESLRRGEFSKVDVFGVGRVAGLELVELG